MHLLQSFTQLTPPRPSACTIGAFDGVHRGHQQLIGACVAEAIERQCQSVVITFEPIPRKFFGGAQAKQLTTLAQKAELIRGLGADVLLALPFNAALMQTPAETFVSWLLDYAQVVSLWVGMDFALGANRKGDVNFLQAQGAQHGFDVHVLAPLSEADSVVSSTRIRGALARGDAREAEQLLGRSLLWHADVGVSAMEERTQTPTKENLKDGDDAPLLFPKSGE